MLSQAKLEAEIRSIENKLDRGDFKVREFYEGKVDALSEITEDPSADKCIEVIEQAEKWRQYWDNMMLSPMAGIPGFGEMMVRKSAYYDGKIMATLTALEATINHEEDNTFVSYGNETVEVSPQI